MFSSDTFIFREDKVTVRGTSKPASTAPFNAANILDPLIGDFKPISKIAYSTPAAKALF